MGYGLAVIGVVHPSKVWRNNAVRAGDRLVLTKPIGTGILGTAQKKGRLDEKAYSTLVSTLSELNRRAAETAQKHADVHAATDVTGFGLLGHLREMLVPADEASESPAKKARVETTRLGAV